MLVDNSLPPSTVKIVDSPGGEPTKTIDVVIVSNEQNKSSHWSQEHSLTSTEGEYPSLDSLEFWPGHQRKPGHILIGGHQTRARKLDESEVFIVNVEDDSVIFEDSLVDVPDQAQLDMSHVSVVTVGEEIHVKDSSDEVVSVADAEIIPNHLQNANKAKKFNGKSQSLDEDLSISVNKTRSQHPADKDQRISPDSSVGSLGSRSQSESGSIRSSSGTPAAVHNNNKPHNHITTTTTTTTPTKIDRSDAESIATTTSHDSREPEPNHNHQTEELVVRRTKPAPPPAVAQQMRSKEEIELRNLRKKTRKRTRKFEIDGVQVTTTTSRVIYGDEENGHQYDDHIIRKQELRELKMLQKQEKKQFLELQTKEGGAREQQERRFEQERITLERTYEADMDTLARQHKQLVDRTEQQQETDLRATSKRIRSDQERELKLVRIE